VKGCEAALTSCLNGKPRRTGAAYWPQASAAAQRPCCMAGFWLFMRFIAVTPRVEPALRAAPLAVMVNSAFERPLPRALLGPSNFRFRPTHLLTCAAAMGGGPTLN